MNIKKRKKIFKLLKKSLTNLLVAIIIAYILFLILFVFFQKSFIYFPNNQDFENCNGFKGYERKLASNTRFYYKQGSSNNAFIYYHGNAGSTCDRSIIKGIFEKNNYSILFVEYSGYSNDSVNPSIKRIYKDVKNIHNFLQENNYKNNIVYGQSLGSGPASYHASLGGVKKLILVNTFSSIEDVAKSIYPFYPVSSILIENYNNQELLKGYDGEILILHGEDDKEISPRFSKKLYNSLNAKNKEYILIENFGHNDIWLSPLFKENISEIID